MQLKQYIMCMCNHLNFISYLCYVSVHILLHVPLKKKINSFLYIYIYIYLNKIYIFHLSTNEKNIIIIYHIEKLKSIISNISTSN